MSEKGRKGFKRENRKNVKDVKGIEWLKKKYTNYYRDICSLVSNNKYCLQNNL